MADNEIRNPAKAYFKWKLPVIAKSEDDWNFWNTEDKYNRTLFIGYNDTTTPHVASLFLIEDGKAIQAVGDDVLARIAQTEINVAQALADVQALIEQANEQQQSINKLQQEVQTVLQDCIGYADDAQTWAEGSDEDVADLGGEHSAKGWAQKANEIVSSGLPSDATFDHITVTSSSKFGQDPDRENEPGLEIEGTGEIQAYRTVNMHNGATVDYDETVELPWSDSSNKVPNTKWVQDAIVHGSGVDPDADVTCQNLTVQKNITMGTYATMGYSIATEQETVDSIVGSAIRIQQRAVTSTKPLSIRSYVGNTQAYGEVSLFGKSVTIMGFDSSPSATYQLNLKFGNLLGSNSYHPESWTEANAAEKGIVTTGLPFVINGGSLFLYSEHSKSDAVLCALGGTTTGLGEVSGYTDYAMLFQRKNGKHEIDFGITPTVPDIEDATDSSSNVPNTKWVQAAIAASGGGGSGAVTSVNSKTGEVVLSGEDIRLHPTVEEETYPTISTVIDSISSWIPDAASDEDKLVINSELTTALATKQDKLTAGDGISISDANVISCTVTPGTGSVSSVNGKTGEVVLSAADVGAASKDDLASYVTTNALNTELTNYATTSAVDTKLTDYQPKLIAGDGISISDSNVISATGAATGSVTSVNGKTGKVVLAASDVGATTSEAVGTQITTALEPYAKTVDVNSALKGKQDTITDSTALVTKSIATNTDVEYSADASFTRVCLTDIVTRTGSVGYVTIKGDEICINGKTTATALTYLAHSGIFDTTAQPTASTSSTRVGTTAWVQGAIDAKIANLQPKLTAGEGITISTDNVISASGGSGGGAVDSVNGKTGTVVLTGEDIKTSSSAESATIASTLNSFAGVVAGKQDEITSSTALTVASLTAGDGNSSSYMGQYSMRYSSGGSDKFFVNAQGPVVSDLTGGDMSTSTGQFNWYMNTTTDYNKFNVFSRYYTTDAETGDLVANDVQVLSAGGSPNDHSTWIDFTANYLSFKGAANFGETGTASHTMNFNGDSTFYADASFNADVHFQKGSITFWYVMEDGSSLPSGSFTSSTGVFELPHLTSTDGGNGVVRLQLVSDSRESDYGLALTGLPFTTTGTAAFNGSSVTRATGPAADDNSTELATTAWVRTLVEGGSGGGIDENTSVTCKNLVAAGYDSGLTSIAFAGNLEFTGDSGNASLGQITCNEIQLHASGYYSTFLRQSGLRLIRGASGDEWFNADSANGTLNVAGVITTIAPDTGDNSTRVPTTAWVNTAIAAKASKPTKSDSVTNTLSGAASKQVYTIVKNGNLWSVHVVLTLNSSELTNGTSEEWAFLSSVSGDADLTKLLAGQVLSMNAYISGHDGTTAAQNGYNALGVTTTRLDGGDLKAVVRSFNSTVTSIPAGLELSFDLTTWVSGT